MRIFDYLFKKNDGICIFCGHRVAYDKMIIHAGDVGACEECHKRLPIVPVGNVFPGKKYIDYTLSAFYYLSPVREAIIDFKFNNCRAYVKILGYYFWCAASVMMDIPDDSSLSSYDMIVPVPLSRERYLERGYNQSTLIAAELSEKSHIPVIEEALVKAIHTKRQSSLDSINRSLNVRNSITADEKIVHSKRIILVDDIYTTGSTLEACARELKEKGALKVIGLTLSRLKYKEHSDAYRELFY